MYNNPYVILKGLYSLRSWNKAVSALWWTNNRTAVLMVNICPHPISVLQFHAAYPLKCWDTYWNIQSVIKQQNRWNWNKGSIRTTKKMCWCVTNLFSRDTDSNCLAPFSTLAAHSPYSSTVHKPTNTIVLLQREPMRWHKYWRVYYCV